MVQLYAVQMGRSSTHLVGEAPQLPMNSTGLEAHLEEIARLPPLRDLVMGTVACRREVRAISRNGRYEYEVTDKGHRPEWSNMDTAEEVLANCLDPARLVTIGTKRYAIEQIELLILESDRELLDKALADPRRRPYEEVRKELGL